MKYSRAIMMAGITVILGACQPQAMSRDATQAAENSDLLGVWVVEYIAERPVLDNSPARIQFGADGAINGNASCNRFFGKYSYDAQALAIDQLGSTRMMCLPALMEQEARLLEFLSTATSARIEDGLLVLHDAEGNQIIRASVDESAVDAP